MTLTYILVLAAVALLARLAAVRRPVVLAWAMFVLSALAIYWLQSGTPIRYASFWFPTLTIALTVFAWALTTPPEARITRENRDAALVLAGVILLIGLTRLIVLPDWINLPRPPQTLAVLAGIVAVTILGLLLARFSRPNPLALALGMGVLLALFVVLKSPPLALITSTQLRALGGQSTALALATDLRWLGFSYVAFRLIHTLRDRQTGRLPVVSLREYVTYVIFFPAYTAGPIDRLERFVKDLRSPNPAIVDDFLFAGRRLAIGLFKKFVLADSLALIALSPQNAAQTASTGWLWVLLYAYTLQIWLDFSGYTDIAIGIGALLGIRLPENFLRPYLWPNLGQFWNHWHMTLTMWFRAYFFNPLTRALRQKRWPVVLVILVTQVATMVLIGLWHGITWSFVAWGLWHGLGLFIQNRWTEFARPRFADLAPAPRRALDVLSSVFTFHYVALGWVWFALPTLPLASSVMLRLFGL